MLSLGTSISEMLYEPKVDVRNTHFALGKLLVVDVGGLLCVKEVSRSLLWASHRFDVDPQRVQPF